jgi:endogenous inhibitor of DNA gyrase (YacG/DUF329 family)
LPQCPICNKTITAEIARKADWLPFCSERCRNIDLFRWLGGKYAIVEPLSPEQLAVERERQAAPLGKVDPETDA